MRVVLLCFVIWGVQVLLFTGKIMRKYYLEFFTHRSNLANLSRKSHFGKKSSIFGEKGHNFLMIFPSLLLAYDTSNIIVKHRSIC